MSQGAEPNTEDGHPKPGSFTPSDETTAGAPTFAVVEADPVTATVAADAPSVGVGAAADAVTLNGASVVADNGVVWMVGEPVEDPVKPGSAGTGGTVPESPDTPNAQTVTPIPITITALTTQIARAEGLRRRVG